MNNLIKNNIPFFLFFIIFLIVTSLFLSCDDSGVTPTEINNPNVKSYDSIGVEEDSTLSSFTGINLLDGVNTGATYYLRDCSLNDSGNTGFNFYLQTGILDNLLDPGYDTRFFRVDTNMSKERFDSISSVDAGTSLDSLDFTQSSTEFWGYFNAPLQKYPVFCFWLKGKYPQYNNGKHVYGIIQPREATDRDPSGVYGYRMSFRVRININGENDFRKKISVNP